MSEVRGETTIWFSLPCRRSVLALAFSLGGGLLGACDSTLTLPPGDGSVRADAAADRDAGASSEGGTSDGGASAADSAVGDAGDGDDAGLSSTCGDEVCGRSDSCGSCALDCGECPAASDHIIFEETFEGSSYWEGLHEQLGTDHGFTVVDRPVFNGERSGRFELRESDPERSGGTRSEVLFPEQDNLERWFAFSVFFEGYEFDSHPEIINQWHQGGGTSPSIALEIMNDRYRLVIPSMAAGTGSTERIDLGPVAKDQWNRFVIHIRHSSSADGLIEIWLNGTSILSRSGSNMYDLSSYSPPRWKVGIYKWRWNGDMTTDTDRRVLYYDDIRIGDEGASYADM